MERPGKLRQWIYVPGHAGLEGNDTAHRLAVEGMCMNVLWARPRTSFSVAPEGSDAEAPVPVESLSPPLGRGQDLGAAGQWLASSIFGT